MTIMKYLTLIIVATLFTMSCNPKNESDINSLDNEIALSDETVVIEIGEFENKAGNYINKEVKVQGIVDHVCKHGGKKLLLVNDDGDVHVTTSDNRFEEELIGEEILVTGLVEEFRVDEAYCIQMDEDNIKSHKEGNSDKELYEKKKHNIKAYRDSMEAVGVDHLSYYSLVFVSYEIIGEDLNIK